MSELSDYKRMVEEPHVRGLEATIAKLSKSVQQARAEGFKAGIEAAADSLERSSFVMSGDDGMSGVIGQILKQKAANIRALQPVCP